MRFCRTCRNMYYIRIDETTTNLIYYCHNCGTEDDTFNADSICVMKQYLKRGGDADNNYNINEYSKFDPTLPRINTVLCPNTTCPTNKDAAAASTREIIYKRYDEQNMKYLYMCTTCDTIWKP